jgi:SAM-dependent methyltransferase
MRPVPPTGHWHEDYERGRPGWPAAVLEIVDVPRSATVLDLGAGSGKLTRLLVERFDRAIAVEPDPAMRGLLALHAPRAELHDGSAESIPLGDGSVDAVFVAEAFHGFDGERALAEIARVVRPRGKLALLWNVPAGPTEPAVDHVEDLLRTLAPPDVAYDPVDLNSRRYASGAWRAAFAGSAFEKLRDAALDNPQTVDRAGLVAFYESMGWFGDLPEHERAQLAERILAMLDAEHYRRSWKTRVHWTRRR